MSRRICLPICLAVVAVLAAGSPEATAQVNAIASGNWSGPATWSPAEPVAGDLAFIDNNFTVTVDEFSEMATWIDLGSADGQTGTLRITGGDLTAIDSDTLNPDNLVTMRVGSALNSTGTLEVSDGALFIDGPAGSNFAIGDLIVGDNGNGTLNQTGGTVIANDEIIIGLQPTSTSTANISGGTLQTYGRSILVGFIGDGTLNVSDDAVVNANFDLLVGFVEGSTGNFNQSGGTVDAGIMFSNYASGGAGSTANINMTGGTFNARIAYVLGQGVGTTVMTHSGGVVNTLQSNGDFVVSDGGGNTSTYNVSGTAQVNTLHSFVVSQFNGSNGTVNQTGGTITIGDGLVDEHIANLVVGREEMGVYNLNGGTVVADNVFLGDYDTSNGFLNVAGGALNVRGDLNVGAALASNAPNADVRVEPSAETGAQGQALDANGTFTVIGTGGDVNVAGNLLANPADKSPFRNAPVDQNSALLKFTLGSAGISPIDVALKADLDGAVIDIDDSAGYFTANPAAQLTLISAAGGIGNVFTVTPTEAASTGRAYTLATGDESAFNVQIVPRPGGGEMLVVSKGAGGLAGDLDGNGVVDGADFLAWQRGYGAPYTVADLNNIKANFGMTGATPAVGAVPEPAAAVLSLGLWLGATLLRRKRLA